MFDIDVKAIKDAVAEESIQKVKNYFKQENGTTKLSREDSLVFCASSAIEIAAKMIEENNKAIWNELVKLGVIKD